MRRINLSLWIALLILVISSLICLTIGTYQISVSEILRIFYGTATDIQKMTILDLRLPRILTGILAGSALAASGSLLQTLTKNDLAEPGIIGINAGASLAIILVINAGGTVYYNALSDFRMFLLPFAAVTGALLASWLIFVMGSRQGHISRTALVLVGIGVNAGLNAIITFYQLRMSKGDYNQALTWISGSLWGSSWKFLRLAAPPVILLFIFLITKFKTLDVMDLNDDMATGLGINVHKERKIMFAVAVTLAALATAIAGNLAFVGLLGPHIAKRLAGPSYRRHLPVAIVLSSILVVIADTICRNAFSPLEIPAGIMISLLGVPYFIYLMLRS